MSEEKSFPKTSINWYPGHMAKTKRLIKENIDKIDIVYEVVDARIPYSSKIIDIDEYIQNKPRIMILTKYDLCDQVETERWINHYKAKGYEVIPMDIVHSIDVKAIINKTKELMEPLIKKRIDKGLMERRTRALVVGIPNAGKSTLINRLVGRKVVNVGNKPGVTKNLDWIRIHEDVELLDTPGILWPKFEDQQVALNLASLTAIKEEILPLDEVVYYILETLSKYYPNVLNERYGIDELPEDFIETIDLIGRKRGCMMRGGIVDEEKVYSIVLQDIKEGYIKGITFDRYEDE